VKVWGIPNGPAARGTKINGAYLTVRQKDGSLVVRAWPRKRGHYQSQRQRDWGEWFGAVSRWATSPDPGSQLYALQVVVGTIFMPRDVLIKIAAGKLWDVQLADGTNLWNIWLMADQIQVMLDTITETPGSLLYRSPQGWVAVEPTKSGDILTLTDNAATPRWAPPSGGKGGATVAPAPSGTTNNTVAQTKGLAFTPLLDLALYGVWARATYRAGDKVQGWVVALNDLTVSEILGMSDEIDITSTTNTPIYFELPFVANIPKGQKFAFGVTRISGSVAWLDLFVNTGTAAPFSPAEELNMRLLTLNAPISIDALMTDERNAGGVSVVYGVK